MGFLKYVWNIGCTIIFKGDWLKGKLFCAWVLLVSGRLQWVKSGLPHGLRVSSLQKGCTAFLSWTCMWPAPLFRQKYEYRQVSFWREDILFKFFTGLSVCPEKNSFISCSQVANFFLASAADRPGGLTTLHIAPTDFSLQHLSPVICWVFLRLELHWLNFCKE